MGKEYKPSYEKLERDLGIASAERDTFLIQAMQLQVKLRQALELIQTWVDYGELTVKQFKDTYPNLQQDYPVDNLFLIKQKARDMLEKEVLDKRHTNPYKRA